MFSFFKRKAPAVPAPPTPESPPAPETVPPADAAAGANDIPDLTAAPEVGGPPETAAAEVGETAAAPEAKRSWFQRFLPSRGPAAAPEPEPEPTESMEPPAALAPSEPPVTPAPVEPAVEPTPFKLPVAPAPVELPVAPAPVEPRPFPSTTVPPPRVPSPAHRAAAAPAPAMPAPPPTGAPPPAAAATAIAAAESETGPALAVAEPPPPTAEERRPWLDRLRSGLRRTGAGIAQAFTGTRIDEALYEELEAALLMADAGLPATEHLLADLRRRVKEARATDPGAVKSLLADAVADLLAPLERQFEIGGAVPTVVMVAGVNGAGKTTTIGKLTRHLAEGGVKVLLAAADTFRAAAKEQLAVWADRNQVEIVSQAGGDPAAVSFDAIRAGQARRCEVVIADTAGRLPTQAHLMDELRKIHRTIGKAMDGAPHEVLLVVDGNTGQNALAQVKAFDAVLGLTGLVVTKLDGTAKGGVLAAIALWSREREREGGRGVPVYFIGVGEKLEDLETFDAREFSQALLA